MSLSSLDLIGSNPYRALNNEYQFEMLASNSQQIVDYQRDALILQGVAAIANLSAQGRIAENQKQLIQVQGEANEHLRQISQGIEATVNELQNLNVTVEEGFNAVRNGLKVIAQQMLQQQRTLETIAEILRRPYETKALELRNEADKWLKRGMKNTGRDRDEDWKDAMRLLKATTANPVGMQDYVAWFQIGWLQWRHEGDTDEATKSFYRAARLSADSKDLYCVKSLRHFSHMHYLKSDYDEAWETIKKALLINHDHDTMYDAARYAAKVGRDEGALNLLSKCIDLRPTTIIAMYSEVDFQ